MNEFKLKKKHWQKNYDCWQLETNQMLKKIKNRLKQNFEDEANSMQLDKEDTQRSKLNSKYLSVTLLWKYPDSSISCHCVQQAYLKSMILYCRRKPD